MGLSVFPESSSPVKSVQRGTAAAAGTVTISAVNTSKSFVRSFSNGSTGSVAVSGTVSSVTASAAANTATIAAHTGTLYAGTSTSNNFASPISDYTPRNWPISATTASIPSFNVTIPSATISGGSTSLTSAEYGAYLTGSTSLVVTGPCYWEVVEFN